MAALPEAALEHRAYGGTLLNRGLLVAAGHEFRRWLDVVEPTGDPDLIVPPLNALSTVSQARLDFEGSISWLDQAVPYMAPGRLDPLHAARTRINRMFSLLKLGRVEEAVEEAESAQELVCRIGSPYLAGVVNLNLATIHFLRREFPQMRRVAQKALDQFSQAGDTAAMGDALVNVGVAHLELGSVKLARRDLTRALRLLTEGEGGLSLAYAYTELGRLEQLQGCHREAVVCGTQALDILLGDVSTLDKEEVAKVSELFGGLFAETGDRNLALKYLNRAAAYFSQLGRLLEWQRVTDRIGQVLMASRRSGQSPLRNEVQRLDFLTAVLDLTDDLESVDPYLRGHSERVASLAVVLGRQVGLSDRELRLLNYAARLHDVGMVAVEPEILQKPGELSATELERVRIHPVIGEELVRPYVGEKEVLKAIRQHHEHWNGEGYPDRISGDQISLLARLITVTDVYDALTSDRVYRRALDHDQAVALMRQMAGQELDPHLVETFVLMHRV